MERDSQLVIGADGVVLAAVTTLVGNALRYVRTTVRLAPPT
jgi:hypothetical protein